MEDQKQKKPIVLNGKPKLLSTSVSDLKGGGQPGINGCINLTFCVGTDSTYRMPTYAREYKIKIVAGGREIPSGAFDSTDVPYLVAKNYCGSGGEDRLGAVSFGPINYNELGFNFNTKTFDAPVEVSLYEVGNSEVMFSQELPSPIEYIAGNAIWIFRSNQYNPPTATWDWLTIEISNRRQIYTNVIFEPYNQ